MSGSSQGALAKRLKFPKGRQKARKLVDDVIKTINGHSALSSDDRRALLEIAMKHRSQLEVHGQDSKQKEAAIQAATIELDQIDQKINAAVAIRGEALNKLEKARTEQNKNIFTRLRQEADTAGIKQENVPILKEWADLCSNAYDGVRKAKDAKTADNLASRFEIASVQIAGRAGTSRDRIAGDIDALKKKAQDTRDFDRIMKGIATDLDTLEVLTGNIDEGSLSRERQKDLLKRYWSGNEDIAEGLGLAQRLRTDLDGALARAHKAGEDAMAPLKVRFGQIKASADELRAIKTRSMLEETGLDIDLPYLGLTHYWPLVDEKFVTVERCFTEKMPATGAPFVASQLDELDKMLKEVVGFHRGDDGKLGKAIDAVNELRQRKKFMFFDTDLQKYLPNEAKILNTQFKSMDKDCKSMKPSEILQHMEAMKLAAESAHTRSKMLKDLCENTGAKALAEADKELEAIVKELAKLPNNVRDGHKTFHGDYRRSRDELAAALKFGAEGPDEKKIRALIGRLTTQLADLKKGDTLDSDAIGDSHKAGCKAEAEEKEAKNKVKAKKEELNQLYEDVKKVVAEATPGDENELKAIKRLMKEVNDSVKGLPPATALERYDQVETRLTKLKNAPQGSAVLARGQLPKDHENFVAGLNAAINNLKALETLVAQDYAGDGKDELKALIGNSISMLQAPQATIKKATDLFAKNAGLEQLAGRLKAREIGLGGVRQYQKLLATDAVVLKLTAENVFANSGISALRGALNSLELNLLRGI